MIFYAYQKWVNMFQLPIFELFLNNAFHDVFLNKNLILKNVSDVPFELESSFKRDAKMSREILFSVFQKVG